MEMQVIYYSQWDILLLKRGDDVLAPGKVKNMGKGRFLFVEYDLEIKAQGKLKDRLSRESDT